MGITEVKIKKIKNEIMVLRNYHKSGLEMADKLLSELEVLSPSNPSPRTNKKQARIAYWQDYLARKNSKR